MRLKVEVKSPLSVLCMPESRNLSIFKRAYAVLLSSFYNLRITI